MALKNQPEYESESTAPTATATAEAAQAPAQAEPQAAAQVAATTAIAKAATTAVATPKKFNVAFGDMKDVLDMSTVSALAIAAPRVTAESGDLVLNRNQELGKSLQIEVVSWNHRWAIGTGSNDAEAKTFFKVSYDNKTLDGEPDVTVVQYLEGLKARGFDKAHKSPYAELWGFVTWTEKGGPIKPEDMQLTVIQCSETSLGNFTAFCVGRGMLESRGIVPPTQIIEITAKNEKNARNEAYTNMTFKAVAPK